MTLWEKLNCWINPWSNIIWIYISSILKNVRFIFNIKVPILLTCPFYVYFIMNKGKPPWIQNEFICFSTDFKKIYLTPLIHLILKQYEFASIFY